MKLHWAHRWMAIPYGGGTAVLHGAWSKPAVQSNVQLCQLTEDDLQLDDAEDTQSRQVVPVEVQNLLHDYADVFASSVSFPPFRAYSHSILLILGA
jgi:hypothetical protein